MSKRDAGAIARFTPAFSLPVEFYGVCVCVCPRFLPAHYFFRNLPMSSLSRNLLKTPLSSNWPISPLSRISPMPQLPRN